MATQHILKSAYADVSRVAYSNIPAADLAKLDTLAQQVDASALSLTAARVEIAKMVLSTTSVASLSYAFFTGVTPLACPSSTNSRGVWRIPSEVRRIAGGIATITVATSAVAGP